MQQRPNKLSLIVRLILAGLVDIRSFRGKTIEASVGIYLVMFVIAIFWIGALIKYTRENEQKHNKPCMYDNIEVLDLKLGPGSKAFMVLKFSDGKIEPVYTRAGTKISAGQKGITARVPFYIDDNGTKQYTKITGHENFICHCVGNVEILLPENQDINALITLQ